MALTTRMAVRLLSLATLCAGSAHAQSLINIAPLGGGLARDWANTTFVGANPVVNDNGQVAGTLRNALGAPQAFVFTVGSNSGPMAIGTNGYATGINNAGQITVVRGIGPNEFTQIYDSSGHLQTNVGPNNVTTIAWGINKNGETAGRTVQLQTNSSGAKVDVTVPFSATATGQSQILTVGSTFGGLANSINDAGNVVGGIFQSGDANNIHAFAYSAATGTSTDLAATLQNALSPTAIVRGSVAFGINNRDQITGAFHTSTGAEHAFLYSDTSHIVDITANVEGNSVGYGIDDAGDVVGEANIRGGNGKPQFAFLYTQSGGLMDLNQYALNHGLLASGETLINAVSISANGKYIAGLAEINGTTVNYVMSMVPEPASGKLFACAMALMGLARWRSRRQG